MVRFRDQTYAGLKPTQFVRVRREILGVRTDTTSARLPDRLSVSNVMVQFADERD